MAVETSMQLTKVEREAITDTVLKIESIQASLEQIDEGKLPERDEIESCLETADKNLRMALREQGASERKPTAR